MADGSCRNIAGIGENGEAFALALLVHFTERSKRHQQFAANFKVCGQPGFLDDGRADFQRDRPHCAHVERHVFANGAVTASDATLQRAIFVAQCQGHAVEFQFANVVYFATPAEFEHATFPVAQLFFAVRVVE